MLQTTNVLTGFLVISATLFLAASHLAAGKALEADHGLRLTIHCDETELRVGDEIPVTFVIENEGEARTDESVATLKKLLEAPNPPGFRSGRGIRDTTESAIRSAYRYRGNTKGEGLLRSNDIEAKYQTP